MPQQSIDKSVVKASWGNRGGMGSTASRGAGFTGYEYGWPSGGTLEPNVSLQFIYDEGSGDIYDEVSSFRCDAYTASGGSLTYTQTLSGAFSNLSPGIYCNASGGYATFYANSNPAVYSITGDFVIEFWATLVSTSSLSTILFATGGSDWGNSGYTVKPRMNAAGNPARLIIRATDATTVNADFTVSPTVYDNAIHKWRFTGSLGGNVELFIDGVTKGTVSLATLSGKTVTFNRMNHGYDINAILYEYRITIGNSTNNSGGPGGG